MSDKTDTPHRSGRFLRRAAVAGAIFFTAVVVCFRVVTSDPASVIRIMTPAWMLTMFTAVATYAAGAYLARRTASVQATIEDRVPAAV